MSEEETRVQAERAVSGAAADMSRGIAVQANEATKAAMGAEAQTWFLRNGRVNPLLRPLFDLFGRRRGS